MKYYMKTLQCDMVYFDSFDSERKRNEVVKKSLSAGKISEICTLSDILHYFADNPHREDIGQMLTVDLCQKYLG